MLKYQCGVYIPDNETVLYTFMDSAQNESNVYSKDWLLKIDELLVDRKKNDVVVGGIEVSVLEKIYSILMLEIHLNCGVLIQYFAVVIVVPVMNFQIIWRKDVMSVRFC